MVFMENKAGFSTDDMSEKEKILTFLECTYSGAKMKDDIEMKCRLSRAIIAFSYDDIFNIPTWEEMLDSYMLKD